MGSSKLKGIRRAQRMNVKQSHRGLPDRLAWINLVPIARELFQSSGCHR